MILKKALLEHRISVLVMDNDGYDSVALYIYDTLFSPPFPCKVNDDHENPIEKHPHHLKSRRKTYIYDTLFSPPFTCKVNDDHEKPIENHPHHYVFPHSPCVMHGE